jgi:seryl-tRNA synthetase
MLQLPNFSHQSVPVAEDESGNEVIKTVGEKRKLENPQPHYEIPSIKPLIDFERGAKVSGSRFWYLKGPLVNLEFALIQYALAFYAEKGFTPMRPPSLVNQEAMQGTGFFPADANEIYTVEDETAGDAKKYLSGTAEVPLASYHAGEKLDPKELPVKYIGFAPAYRREAGSYGKDTKGIIRGHEFDKLELFVFSDPAKSWEMHEELQAHAEEFWTSLGIPFQVVNIASGDLGPPNAKKLDIEAWMPGEGKYREVASNSNDTDFQARRLGIKTGQEYVHTLNNTACAVGRAIVAIVENYQQENGTVVMPDALHQYLPFKEITKE